MRIVAVKESESAADLLFIVNEYLCEWSVKWVEIVICPNHALTAISDDGPGL
jgi:hypothetical protein